MRRSIGLLVLSALFLQQASCLYLGGAVSASGTAERRLEETGSYDEVRAKGSVNIILTSGQRVETEMADAVRGRIKIETVDGALIIEPLQNFFPFGRGSVNIYVGAGALKRGLFILDGALTTQAPLAGSDLELYIGGACRANIESRASRLKLTVSSAERTTISGSAQQLELRAINPANIDLRKFSSASRLIEADYGTTRLPKD